MSKMVPFVVKIVLKSGRRGLWRQDRRIRDRRTVLIHGFGNIFVLDCTGIFFMT